MNWIDADTLRAAALARLDRRAVPGWVRAALTEGALRLAHATTRWTASEGEHVGHRVILGLDAGCLGRLRVEPHARQELEGALGGAMVGRPRESIADLAMVWDGTVVTHAAGYRASERTRLAASLDEALRAWLREVEPAVADASFVVDASAGEFRVRRARDAQRALLEEALQALTRG